jgi:hypothetical protein
MAARTAAHTLDLREQARLFITAIDWYVYMYTVDILLLFVSIVPWA